MLTISRDVFKTMAGEDKIFIHKFMKISLIQVFAGVRDSHVVVYCVTFHA